MAVIPTFKNEANDLLAAFAERQARSGDVQLQLESLTRRTIHDDIARSERLAQQFGYDIAKEKVKHQFDMAEIDHRAQRQLMLRRALGDTSVGGGSSGGEYRWLSPAMIKFMKDEQPEAYESHRRDYSIALDLGTRRVGNSVMFGYRRNRDPATVDASTMPPDLRVEVEKAEKTRGTAKHVLASIIANDMRRGQMIDPKSVDALAVKMNKNMELMGKNLGYAVGAHLWGEENMAKWFRDGGGTDPKTLARMPAEVKKYIRDVTGTPLEGWIVKNDVTSPTMGKERDVYKRDDGRYDTEVD